MEGKGRVYPWALLQGITLWVPQREEERETAEEQHPVTHQSLLFRFYLFHIVFTLLFTQIVFPSISLLFKLCAALCESRLLLWKLKRGDKVGPNPQISLFVFRLSRLLLSLFIYCTIIIQFMPVLVRVKCVFTIGFGVLQVPLCSCHSFPGIIPTVHVMYISYCSTDALWFTPTTTSETLTQTRFLQNQSKQKSRLWLYRNAEKATSQSGPSVHLNLHQCCLSGAMLSKDK